MARTLVEMSEQHHVHQHHQHEHHAMFDTPEAATRLEMEGEVLADFVKEAVEATITHAEQFDLAVERILDLGSGPGVGSCAWAVAIPASTVTAVDGSLAMLDRVTARAASLGVGSRVVTRQHDLATGLEALGRHDVAFSSMALHHVGDETAALVAIRKVLDANGLLVILERAAPEKVRFAGESLGSDELWNRVNAAWSAWLQDMRASLPGAEESADYCSMLASAGFEVLEDRTLSIMLPAPLTPAGRRFARARMGLAATGLTGYLDESTLAEVTDLLADLDGPGSHRWDTAEVEATQRLLIGRAG